MQGLLSGNPALSSGDMMGSLKTAASTAATAVNKPAAAAGQVVGAYRAAKNGPGGATALGTFSNLARSTVADSVPGIKGYRGGNAAVRQSLSRRAGNKNGYTPDDEDEGGSGSGSYEQLAKQRVMLGAMAEAIGGEGAKKKFEDKFDAATGFQPKPKESVRSNAGGSAVSGETGLNPHESSNDDKGGKGKGGDGEAPSPNDPLQQPPKPLYKKKSHQEELRTEKSDKPSNISAISDTSRIRDLETENRNLKAENSGMKMENASLRNGASGTHGEFKPNHAKDK